MKSRIYFRMIVTIVMVAAATVSVAEVPNVVSSYDASAGGNQSWTSGPQTVTITGGLPSSGASPTPS